MARPGDAAAPPGFGSSSLSTPASFCPMTYTWPDGSAAVKPNNAPPLLPGRWTVSTKLIGVNKPRLRAPASRFLNASRASSVTIGYGLMSSAVNVCREKGGGFVGYGCVGHDCSPDTSLLGTGRSSIGQIGAPVTRSNPYRKPVLPAMATTSTSLPPLLMRVNCGAALLSKSHRSWWTVWKCQSRLPVLASSARMQSLNRSAPMRSAP